MKDSFDYNFQSVPKHLLCRYEERSVYTYGNHVVAKGG